MGYGQKEDPWWWGFGMPARQRFVVAVLCWVVFFVVERLEAPFWLAIPAVVVFIACLPGVVELVVKGTRGNGR
jgi:hypothetical protein